MRKNDIILGAGVAGLGASLASDYRLPVYEGEAIPGGLCSGFEIGGFHFDRGAHLSFATSKIVRNLFDQTPYFCYHPCPDNWYHDRWIKHPVQNNLYSLPVEDRVNAVKSFVDRPVDMHEQNFAAWNISRFGYYISEKFMFQYNKKYWCEELDKIGTQWIGQRLYQPTLEEVLFGSYTDQTPNRYYVKEMRYPVANGYVAFLKAVMQNSQIYCGKRVIKIDGDKRQIYFADGTEVNYRYAFSSIPLTSVVQMITNVPDKVLQSAEKLNHTGVALVSVGLKRENVTDKIWFYIYDEDIMAARVHSPTNKSANNAPEGCSSLQFEIYFNGKMPPPEENACISNTLFALKKLQGKGGIHTDLENDILFVDYRIQKYGNVIIYPDNDANTSVIKEYLFSLGIIPIGRFGEWDYLWSDQALLSGYHAVKNNLAL